MSHFIKIYAICKFSYFSSLVPLELITVDCAKMAIANAKLSASVMNNLETVKI